MCGLLVPLRDEIKLEPHPQNVILVPFDHPCHFL